jgi:hypothetical protein
MSKVVVIGAINMDLSTLHRKSHRVSRFQSIPLIVLGGHDSDDDPSGSGR